MTTKNRFGLAARGAVLASIIVATSTAIAALPIEVSEAAPSNSGAEQCIQGQLQVAIKQGGGLIAHTALGNTFLIVNTSNKSCSFRGYPRETAFSSSGDELVKVSISHQWSALIAQPKPQRVVLRRGGVASFGISYTYKRVTSTSEATSCQARLIDVRLPAQASRLFSYEFAVSCDAGRKVEVTPVEGRTAPQA